MSQLLLLKNKVIEEKVLLHGSGRQFYELRPTKRIHDGPSAICATQFPEIAVLMVVLCNCKGKGGVKYKNINTEINPVLHLRISSTKLDSLLNTEEVTGYIYILDRYDFERHSLNELRSARSRFVRKPIPVSKSDLPFIPEKGIRQYFF